MARMSISRLNKEPEIDASLKPCPFCGSPAEVQYWHGGGPSKRLIACSGISGTLGGPFQRCEVSPSVTGNTLADARRKWDQRT